jgi:hypothetical protein
MPTPLSCIQTGEWNRHSCLYELVPPQTAVFAERASKRFLGYSSRSAIMGSSAAARRAGAKLAASAITVNSAMAASIEIGS